jgi:ribosomal protein L6P/L9E
MELVKIINLKNKITLRVGKINESALFYFKCGKKVILRVNISRSFFLHQKTLITFGNLAYSNYSNYIEFVTKILENFFYNHYSHFSKLHMIGLGFKNFILGNQLYILVGDCNYIIFFIPTALKLFCKKNQIFILGENEVEIFNFISNVKKIKKSNFYKGKGILQFKNFKFTKLKVGKKQRFM